jgi:anti-sigma regulatory factor (Ser/Thr protein kinase)
MSFEITVPAGPTAPATVRRALTQWLSARSTNGFRLDAPLIVSELVTNCLRHAGMSDSATVRVSAQLTDGVLRLEVEDPGTVGHVARRTPDPDHGGGFGLNIVDALAALWGVQRDESTLVWVELGC